jgi:hypothetical protein
VALRTSPEPDDGSRVDPSRGSIRIGADLRKGAFRRDDRQVREMLRTW